MASLFNLPFNKIFKLDFPNSKANKNHLPINKFNAYTRLIKPNPPIFHCAQ
jgi:hypothetical protein